MGKNPLKRSLIVGIIFLFLSTTCIPVLASEEKPDLIVSDIHPKWGDGPMVLGITSEIGNIENVTVNGTLHIHFIARRMVFGILPIPIKWIEEELEVKDFHSGIGVSTTYSPVFPGIYKFSCTINPHKTIEEINYNNNYFEKKYLIIAPGDPLFWW